MSWWVYIVECADGTYYTGTTNCLERRITAHNEGRGARYTRGRGPVVLRYSERHPDQGAACRREAQIKALSRSQKEALMIGE